MITVKQLIDHLNEMILKDKNVEDLTIIYSTDSEGNNYHHVYNEPSLTTVEDINDYDLEVVFDEYNEEPNCVLIN